MHAAQPGELKRQLLDFQRLALEALQRRPKRRVLGVQYRLLGVEPGRLLGDELTQRRVVGQKLGGIGSHGAILPGHRDPGDRPRGG